MAVLLRLAQAAGRVPIGGFEEPEEALEPLRQTQLARMLRSIVDSGGQIFVVTHSPEIARAFEIDDFVLLRERAAGGDVRPLRQILPPRVRQAYERWVDGAVVRGLFARIQLLVEGPGDRAVIEVFWRRLEAGGQLAPAANLGVDIVNCEGVPNLPMLAAVLNQAGKAVAAWIDHDSEQVRNIIQRLRDEGQCSALVLHDPGPGRQNLEEALAAGCSLRALAAGMEAIAADRGYTWQEQRADLLSRAQGVGDGVRERMRTVQSLPDFLELLEPDAARALVASALASKTVTPFEMKGGRQGRLLAERIADEAGVPENFGRALRALQEWIEKGCARGFEITMTGG